MEHRTSPANNVFIEFICQGRINNLEDLKRSYRKIVMKTHPDATGRADRDDEFVRFSAYYEEAKLFLANKAQSKESNLTFPKVNKRLRFYQRMQRLESLNMPYAFDREEHEAEIRSLKTEAAELFQAWNADNFELYIKADKQHEQIWTEKPRGPYLKHALALNVRPVLHNIVSFQLTGRILYRRQARQNLKAILSRLQEQGYTAFSDYLSLLIRDMENGAALLD